MKTYKAYIIESKVSSIDLFLIFDDDKTVFNDLNKKIKKYRIKWEIINNKRTNTNSKLTGSNKNLINFLLSIKYYTNKNEIKHHHPELF